MEIKNSRILLTGAGGGIGKAIATELSGLGARLCLVDRRIELLEPLVRELRTIGADIETVVADITQSEGRDLIINTMKVRFGGIDMLINNAGIMEFNEFTCQDPAMIEQTFKVNTVAPIQLVRSALPEMLDRRRGKIVNIGSIFGSIAFAWHASYSASKFAMRGFSEALRRELAGSGVDVLYVAPRAVKTALNSPEVLEMAEKVKMHMDGPDKVAKNIVKAIIKDKKDVYLGFPESLFVRINSLFPRIVDSSLRKQNQIMRTFIHKT